MGRAVSTQDLAAEVAELRETIASLRRETEEFADRLSAALNSAGWLVAALTATWRDGCAEAQAEHNGAQAAARQARAAFRVLPGSTAGRKGKSAPADGAG